MNKAENHKYWSSKVREFRESKKTKEEWCKKKNISVKQFNYWLRQFPTEDKTTQWLPVEINETDSGKMDSKQSQVPASQAARIWQKENRNSSVSPFNIKIMTASIEVPPEFDKEHLSEVLKVLKSL